MKTKLTPAQQREYELLKKHGSIYVYGWMRRRVYDNLVIKGLATTEGGGWHWFHLKT